MAVNWWQQVEEENWEEPVKPDSPEKRQLKLR